ncbi:MAG: type II secretion system F family protein [Actinomycetota bacterium]|nr:type II secretion system F family protein [Actinomycetota bacterium]
MTVGLLVLCTLSLLREASFKATRHHHHPVLPHLPAAPKLMTDDRFRLAARRLEGPVARATVAGAQAVLMGWVGFHLAGPVVGVVAAAAGASIPFSRERRRQRMRRQQLDEQFAEYLDAMAMAVRGGLSIRHAMELAAEEAEEPLAEVLQPVLSDHRLGTSFDRVLDGLKGELPANEGRLLTLVLRLHAKSGGNLADSLDEVASAVRQRMAARRELLVLSAQGRMSGAILGLLPVAFFIVLAASSRSEMGPILRSPAGIALVSSGLTLQGLGFVWIRRLLRVRL